jgi:hypothetical protein
LTILALFTGQPFEQQSHLAIEQQRREPAVPAIARDAEALDGFGHEGASDLQAVLRGASDPAAGGEHKAGQRIIFSTANQVAGANR